MPIRQASSALLLFVLLGAPVRAAENLYDLVVYGGTPGGVTAAVQAAHMGKTVWRRTRWTRTIHSVT